MDGFNKSSKRTRESQAQPSAKKLKATDIGNYYVPSNPAVYVEEEEEEEEEDDDDGERVPVDPSLVEESSPIYQESLEEVLSHLGIPDRQALNWGDVLEKRIIKTKDWDETAWASFLMESWSSCTTSLHPVKDFRDIEGNWATHDVEIDDLWVDHYQTLTELSEGKIEPKFLSKPSGPLKVKLSFQWHFPTWNTSRSTFGHILDESNPSLRVQVKKLGFNDSIRTQDTINIRHEYKKTGVDWGEIYAPNWELMEKECFKFSRTLNEHSKIIMMVGKENAKNWRKLVDLDFTVEAIKIELNLPGNLQIYQSKPHFQLIRCKSTKQIKQLVFFSYHSQFFYYGPSKDQCAYHDLLWNAVASWAHEPINSPNYFLKMGSMNTKPLNQLRLVFQYLREEKATGVIFPESMVRDIFARTISSNPSWTLQADAKTGSFIKGVHTLFWMKSQASRVAAEGRATQASAELQTSEGKKMQPIALLAKMVANRISNADRERRSKFASLLKVKQIREFLAKPDKKRREKVLAMKLGLDPSDPRGQDYQNLVRRVVYWSKDYQGGLRYEGDGCEEPDNFDHSENNHPAVRLDRPWKVDEREQFKDAAPSDEKDKDAAAKKL